MGSKSSIRHRLGVFRRVRRDGRAILSNRELLRRGLYVSEGPRLWRHIDAPLPSFLRVTKARSAGARRSLPLPIYVPGIGSATLAVQTFEGGGVYLDLENQLVTRTYPPEAPASREQMLLRRRFERHTDAPPGTLADDGLSHTEPYIEGMHLGQLPAREQEAAVRRLFNDYARVVSFEGSGDAAGALQESVTASLRLELPDQLEQGARAALEWLGDWTIPWIPSAREANLKNLIVRSDGRVSPIDLGDLAILPSIRYPIGILCEAPRAISRGFLEGSFDDEISGLLSGGGVDGVPEHPTWRQELLMVRLLHVAVCDVRRSAEIPEDSALRAEIQRRWQAVAPLLR